MKLYPYQEKAVNHAIDMLGKRGNSLVVAGTGAGKTIMMAAIIGKYFNGFRDEHKRSPHVLVLVHRTEIHSQNHSKFSLVCPHIATSEITATKKSLHGNIHFGMVQTVVGLLSEFERSKSYFDLIVIDEAHHTKASTYEEIIKWNTKANPDTALLGVTATPNRGDKLPLIELFDNYYQITCKFLIDSHYLTRPTMIDCSLSFETENGIEKGHLSKNVKNDDAGNEIISQMCDIFLSKKEPGKSIIFAPSHKFCEQIYKQLKLRGRNPAYLRSNIDELTRKTEIEKFENGDSEELINVDICTEGYDFPPLRNLVDFDTNGTQSQWIQKVGRVLRTAPGKTSCTVIDFGGNIELYPDWLEVEVNLNGAVKKKKGVRLVEADLFSLRKENKDTNPIFSQEDTKYTPYHLPKGFETVNDSDYGIVYVACGVGKDCIIVKKDDLYTLYLGNKSNIHTVLTGDFDSCIRTALEKIGALKLSDRPISKIQIKMLAPEYPTTALDWDGANCCICWKTWKSEITRK